LIHNYILEYNSLYNLSFVKIDYVNYNVRNVGNRWIPNNGLCFTNNQKKLIKKYDGFDALKTTIRRIDDRDN